MAASAIWTKNTFPDHTKFQYNNIIVVSYLGKGKIN